jgi:hypothetical protein
MMALRSGIRLVSRRRASSAGLSSVASASQCHALDGAAPLPSPSPSPSTSSALKSTAELPPPPLPPPPPLRAASRRGAGLFAAEPPAEPPARPPPVCLRFGRGLSLSCHAREGHRKPVSRAERSWSVRIERQLRCWFYGVTVPTNSTAERHPPCEQQSAVENVDSARNGSVLNPLSPPATTTTTVSVSLRHRRTVSTVSTPDCEPVGSGRVGSGRVGSGRVGLGRVGVATTSTPSNTSSTPAYRSDRGSNRRSERTPRARHRNGIASNRSTSARGTARRWGWALQKENAVAGQRAVQ